MTSSEFTSYYKINFKKIFRYVYSRIPSIHDTEDIVADSFLALWKSNVTIENNTDSYLLRIVKNKINDYLRRKYRIELITSSFEDTIGQTNTKEPEEIKSSNNIVHNVLSLLNTRDKKVIELKYFQGRTNNEIATILGITINNVKVIHNRIIKRIKSNLII
ncbi:sigma-70 family RNA polymerase sigma factor [Candidatus Dojkabacteria bacterium]|uniref:Sigma-70 family RNA polymerase sigma factor n=1 Tax=Candidatus Dojkabacteria bacterium TaxID=2099670 RepID=A0A952DW59_9BACT|nr:sigma-70 family RNA polymerase sigma factor [Candidatus Dojkabacteria bacterium]